jgi:hypothetical protein
VLDDGRIADVLGNSKNGKMRPLVRQRRIFLQNELSSIQPHRRAAFRACVWNDADATVLGRQHPMIAFVEATKSRG